MKNYFTHGHPVDAEVARAYADMTNPDFEAALKIRNLNFKASAFVTRDEAKSILGQWVPNYNEFSPKLLDKFPKGCYILIAREASVCLYVMPFGAKLPSARSVLADEVSIEKMNGFEVTRYWWDWCEKDIDNYQNFTKLIAMKYVFVKIHNNSVSNVSVHDTEEKALEALSRSFKEQTGELPGEAKNLEYDMFGEITISEDLDHAVTPCE